MPIKAVNCLARRAESNHPLVPLASGAVLAASLPASATAGTPGVATLVLLAVSVSDVVLTDVLLVSETLVPVSDVALIDVPVSDVVLTDVLVSDVVLSDVLVSDVVEGPSWQ